MVGGVSGLVEPDWSSCGASHAHDVKFNIGSGTVVCSCGAYFESDRGVYVAEPETAVKKWAKHMGVTRGLTLRDAYERGWRDACDDHLQQGKDPTHPIGARYQPNEYGPAGERS